MPGNERIKARVFDAYGTIFDVHASSAGIVSGLGRKPTRCPPFGVRSSSSTPGCAA